MNYMETDISRLHTPAPSNLKRPFSFHLSAFVFRQKAYIVNDLCFLSWWIFFRFDQSCFDSIFDVHVINFHWSKQCKKYQSIIVLNSTQFRHMSMFASHLRMLFYFKKACKQNPQPPCRCAFNCNYFLPLFFFFPLFSVTVRHSAQGENESKTPLSLALRFITPQQKNT